MQACLTWGSSWPRRTNWTQTDFSTYMYMYIASQYISIQQGWDTQHAQMYTYTICGYVNIAIVWQSDYRGIQILELLLNPNTNDVRIRVLYTTWSNHINMGTRSSWHQKPWCHDDVYTTVGPTKHIERANCVCLDGLDRVVHVLDRWCWRGQVVYLVHCRARDRRWGNSHWSVYY